MNDFIWLISDQTDEFTSCVFERKNRMNKIYKYNPDFEAPCPNCKHTSAVHEFTFEYGKKIFMNLKCHESDCNCSSNHEVVINYITNRGDKK